MAQGTRVGIIGAGWPGVKHAEGYQAAGGFTVAAVADLIPSRRKAIMQQFGAALEFAEPDAMLADKSIEAVSVCLPNHLHAPVVLAALKAGKHVVCETPPALSAPEARKMDAAATKAGKVLLYAAQRRFGGGEQAARQAIEKEYAGEAYHVRASWMRTRGVPSGTGWFTDKAKSGGGAMADLGAQMLDLAWHLLGQPRPMTAFAVLPRRFPDAVPEGRTNDVEDSAFVLLRFEGDKSIELATSWAINQPPHLQGTICRVYGDKGAVDVYTPQGPLLYRNFGPKGEAKEIPLKLPKTVHYPAMMRHFRQCVLGQAGPSAGGREGLALMHMIDAIYRSGDTGRSAEIRFDGETKVKALPAPEEAGDAGDE